VGIRAGEKLHEVMVPEDDARNTLEYDDYFAVLPAYHEWRTEDYVAKNGGKPCPDGFRYSSDTNSHWLTAEEMRVLAGLKEGEDVGLGD
jgi:UDP-N-acetylglucosamine 4,6-dehydratase